MVAPLEPVVAVDHRNLFGVDVGEVLLVDLEVGKLWVVLVVFGLHSADVGEFAQGARAGVPPAKPRFRALLADVVYVRTLVVLLEADLGALEQDLDRLVERVALG